MECLLRYQRDSSEASSMEYDAMTNGRSLRDAFRVLLRLETHLSTAVDRRLRDEVDLPLTRFWCLEVIGDYSTCRVLDIASELSMSVGGISKIVDHLEASGLCIRTSDPLDRRSATSQR